jgi:hypothetical protein
MGLSQRRSIIDSVTGHGDKATLFLQLSYDLSLSIRQHLGYHFIDPQLSGARFFSPMKRDGSLSNSARR